MSLSSAPHSLDSFQRFSISRQLLSLALTTVLALAATGSLSGCFSPAAAVQEGINSATSSAGEQFGKALGAELARAADLPPPGTVRYNQFMVSQARVLFTYGFSAGGMWPAEATYQPGEWTQYRLQAAGEEAAIDTLERAFLKTTEDGNEWWRIRGTQEGNIWVYEALLNPENETVVRLRGKDPEGKVGEVPVTEETVFRSPQRLTEESIEGATIGTESLETPAGTFSAERVEYSGTSSGGTITWFLVEDVPGDVVQYRAEQDENQWTSTLIDYGTGATTQLNSY